ncbi:TIGR03089 family protein [Amycolatopsis antarctica]|uniref:TIGR03089 family protein n=1 Tax=Amycolatopsis antarctica TaxID=1854586 RepID=A0A263DCI8_9PSEU|nr:TIGR03089 family protein [Amycolatopsis antarctica]OZM75095.1 TIGR03089 family protein [Amycolatopsis antarctica]
MSITEQLLRPLLKTAAARPLITHYDDSAGTRVELSVATLANWAAKTANWLVEEVDVEPGDEVAVELPAHWQTAGVLLGAWWCGAHVVTDAAQARVAFTGPGVTTSAAQATAVLALDPLGRGFGDPLPDGALDYLSEARLAGDDFTSLFPIEGDTPALAGSTVDEVLAEARSLAGESGITDGARVLSTMEWNVPGGVLAGLLAPLSAGASLVQVTGPDPAKLDYRRGTERTTVDLLG